MRTKLKVLLLVAVFTMLFSIPTMAAIGTPTGLQQTAASENEVDVKWSQVVGTNIYYEVYVSLDGINWELESSYNTDGTHNIYPLTAGTTYYVKVRAWDRNTDEYGSFTSALKVTTAPQEPENVVQTATTTSSITLTWDACPGATSYKIYKYQNEIETLIGTSTKNTFTVTGMNNKEEVPYSIYVYSERSIGNYVAKSRDSGDLYRSSIVLTPEKISNIEIDCYKSLKEIYIDCEAEYATGYQYECYNSKGKKVKSGTFTYSVNVNGINLNEFYKVRVRAFTSLNNKKVYGSWSDYKYFAHSTTLTKAKNTGKLSLKWKKVKGATNYTIYVSTKSNGGYKKVATTKKLSYTVKKFKKKKIKKRKTYYVKVIANKKVGKKTYKSAEDYNWVF